MGVKRESKPPVNDGLDDVRRLILAYEAVRLTPGPARGHLLRKLTSELEDLGPVACGPWVWRYSKATGDILRVSRDRTPPCQLAMRLAPDLNRKVLEVRQSATRRRGALPGEGHRDFVSRRGVKL